MHLPRGVRVSSESPDVSRACSKFREDLSGFVDETLSERRWSEVAHHLAGCPLCREETAEIRELRSALSNTCLSEVSAPTSLAGRLEAIAGDDSSQPIYWHAGAANHLPSKRKRRKRLAVQGSVAVLALAMGVAVLAVVLAPQPRTIDDAVATAREQFARQATAVNVQEAVGAVLLAQGKGAKFGVAQQAAPHGIPSIQALPISHTAADGMLSRGTLAAVGLRGVQEVLVANEEGGFTQGDVAVTRVAGEGAQLVVFDALGNRFLSSFAPDFSTGTVDVPEAWDFYTYPTPTDVAGRDAIALEARRDEQVVGRWWVDVDTGVLLRSERFDTAGRPTIMVGYKELRVGQTALPANRTPLVSLSKATTSGARGWCVGLQTCPYELAGLPLVAYGSTTTPGEQSMVLVYSNGLQTISVSWTEGVLAAGEDVSAVAATGLPSVSVWQAGQGIVSVVTNGSQKMLSDAVSGLPSPEPYDDGIAAKFSAGLGRLAGLG